MTDREIYNWSCRNRVLRLGDRTWVMGILNTTPDSFSDGGRYSDFSAAVDRALKMVAEGADILDIGGESTRPGAEPVSEKEEIQRTAPLISAIREHSSIPISIDTTKAAVAAEALKAGADIVNDVSAFEADPQMAPVVAESGAGAVLMHMKGAPKTMQNNPEYHDVVSEVGQYLKGRVQFAETFGIHRSRLVLDPGIGFGKTTGHNLSLLRNLPQLAALDMPILVGASRKRFIGELTGRADAVDRKSGSLAVAAWSIAAGTHILRVHDVIDTCDTCRMLDTLVVGDL